MAYTGDVPRGAGWRCGSCGGWVAPGLGHTCAQPAVTSINPAAFLPPITTTEVKVPLTTTEFGACPKCGNAWRRVRFERRRPTEADYMKVWCERCDFGERKPPKDSKAGSA